MEAPVVIASSAAHSKAVTPEKGKKASSVEKAQELAEEEKQENEIRDGEEGVVPGTVALDSMVTGLVGWFHSTGRESFETLRGDWPVVYRCCVFLLLALGPSLLLTLALVCSPLVLSAMATVLVDAKTIKLSWKPRLFVFGLAYAVGGACLIFACWALLLVSAFFPPLWACGWLVLVALSLLGPVDIFFGYFAMLVFPALFVNFGIMYCVSLPLLFFTGIFWTPLVALVWYLAAPMVGLVIFVAREDAMGPASLMESFMAYHQAVVAIGASAKRRLPSLPGDCKTAAPSPVRG